MQHHCRLFRQPRRWLLYTDKLCDRGLHRRSNLHCQSRRLFFAAASTADKAASPAGTNKVHASSILQHTPHCSILHTSLYSVMQVRLLAHLISTVPLQAAYEAVIGIECHIQLSTSTKAFCRCKNEYGAPPNTHVCPVCLGHPVSFPLRYNGITEH